MGYQELDKKDSATLLHNMLDVLGQSEEDSEKVLLKIRQGNRFPPWLGYSNNTVMFCVASKKNNHGAVEPFDPKDAIIDEANSKIKDLQAKVKDFEAKEQRRMGKLASRRRLKATKRHVQEDEVGDNQPKKAKLQGTSGS